ncbi:hypothetical protein IE53DRAFT_412320 [Violaceomyces palustris]|uniref:Uncharacterized protein n=1 Tax=Violaceomyces palustris TaxID=1673888 RepID=A0ACD0NRK4_9BASI|nr:hypothetical protein IE53DRAFT_412320 [Violaceomyces palustris]
MEQVELLHETVVGNKLSATRVDRVKQSATAGLHLAGSLVKAIHKIHFRASNSTKLSSLYLFDAVARHARDITKGRAEGYDYTCVKAPPGSGKQDGSREALEAGASEFVKRAATIVCEVVEDSLRNVTPEQKQQTPPQALALHVEQG